jgi:light-regulated signal transduction histidine kinase (bacteriophytochrome)
MEYKQKDIETILQTAFAFARREFYTRINLDTIEDVTLLELAATLNMLGEELDRNTVHISILETVNKELERKNRELDEFTHAVSHDLQAPLRKIMIFSELLQENLDKNFDRDSLENLSFLRQASLRMHELLNDLLEFSRTSRHEIIRVPVKLDQCIEAAVENLATIISETEAEIDKDEHPQVRGDSTMLTQLYQNLIGNALKFSENSPKIHLGWEMRADDQVFFVKDDGIGIAEEYLPQIFLPFKKLHSKDDYSGSGLGLSICRKIVERHHGKIWVSSTPGEGSIFYFTLQPPQESAHGT